MNLQGKRVILGVTGSIACYKSVSLLRLLIKAGAEVQVLMTPAAKEFVGELTFATLSKRSVYSGIFDSNNTQAHWSNHVELGKWADFMLVAPATCNTLAKMASGICENVLEAVYLSAPCPVFFAPAMDLDMHEHPSVKKNIQTLESYGNIVLPTNSGELASGLVGYGRMLEPEQIMRVLDEYFVPSTLAHRTVVITAGPTYEALDPVRFIGNRSTGKMGYAIAEAFLNQGAKVILVSGPSQLTLTHKNLILISVESAEEMFNAVSQYHAQADTFVMSAAVADYKPQTYASEKIKKKTDKFILELSKTQDILKWVGEHKLAHQFLVGFALETNNEEEYAKGKLTGKNADMIVMNSLRNANSCFGTDNNEVTLFTLTQNPIHIPSQSKKEIAVALVEHIEKIRQS